ncbi:hypothetical protein Sjap_022313 [Stephania japonica]|uniref:RRM domain-containing protein n=1 Tax=Stephania japonica TaxID=461633 RepID=A0AAP0ENP2_9MAGN
MAKKRKATKDPITSVEEDHEPEEPAKEDESNEVENAADGEEEEEEQEQEQEEKEEEEDLAAILEPFNKEQLIDLIRTAASKDPQIVEEVNRLADLDPAHRKLFVHGLGWETTSEKLNDFFSQYGEIEECNVVADKGTGKSKGYGFLLFKHRKSARNALKEPQKKIESRITACQLASAGPVGFNPSHFHQHQHQHQQQAARSSSYPSQDVLPRKIYVGNVNSEIPADRLLAFFANYGEIEEGPLGFDRQTGKPKGYALFIYKTVEGARKALEEPNKNFEGYQLYCQKATDNNKLKAAAAAGAAHGGVVGEGYNVGGGGSGSNMPSGGAFNAPNGALSHQVSAHSSHVYGQGAYMGGTQSFAPQGVPPIQAALAVLAAAGQNPSAFGIPPNVVASMNPALGGMNTVAPAASTSTVPQAMPGYGVGNPGYHVPQQGYQASNPYQAPAPRPNSAMGPMGGYVAR